MVQGDMFLHQGKLELARKRYYAALGGDPESLIDAVDGVSEWAPPVTRLYHGELRIACEPGEAVGVRRV